VLCRRVLVFFGSRVAAELEGTEVSALAIARAAHVALVEAAP
jgi:hypothetical protein